MKSFLLSGGGGGARTAARPGLVQRIRGAAGRGLGAIGLNRLGRAVAGRRNVQGRG